MALQKQAADLKAKRVQLQSEMDELVAKITFDEKLWWWCERQEKRRRETMRLKFGFLLVICALLRMSGCEESKKGVSVDQAHVASLPASRASGRATVHPALAKQAPVRLANACGPQKLGLNSRLPVSSNQYS